MKKMNVNKDALNKRIAHILKWYYRYKCMLVKRFNIVYIGNGMNEDAK